MLAGSSFHPNPCLSRHPWAPRQTLHRSCHNSPRPSTCHRGTEKVHNWRDDPDQHSPLRKKEWLTGWLYFQVYPKATVSIFLKIQKKAWNTRKMIWSWPWYITSQNPKPWHDIQLPRSPETNKTSCGTYPNHPAKQSTSIKICFSCVIKL